MTHVMETVHGVQVLIALIHTYAFVSMGSAVNTCTPCRLQWSADLREMNQLLNGGYCCHTFSWTSHGADAIEGQRLHLHHARCNSWPRNPTLRLCMHAMLSCPDWRYTGSCCKSIDAVGACTIPVASLPPSPPPSTPAPRAVGHIWHRLHCIL